MRKEKLVIVKNIGDIIADISLKNPKWIKDLYFKELRPFEFVNYLTKLQKNLSENGKSIKFEDVLIMLDISNEEDSTINYSESSLIQSLILIRVFEKISQNKEILEQITEKEGE